jgi:signal transduction histidine kinase
VLKRLSASLYLAFRRFSIRRKLMVVLLAIAFVPLGILGLFSVINVFGTTAATAAQTVEDKLNIAELLWDVRLQELATTAQAVSYDNLVIVNLDLGLAEPIFGYLTEIRSRYDLSLAFILDHTGRLMASAGQQNIFSDQYPLPPEALVIGDQRSRLIAMHLAGGEFLGNEGLALDAQGREMALLAVVPIYNYSQTLTGYAVAGMVLGLQDGLGSARFLESLRARVGLPIVLAEGSALVYGSAELAKANLPAELDRSWGTADWSSSLFRLDPGGGAWIMKFRKVAEVANPAKLSTPAGLVLGVAYPEAAYLVNRNITILVLGGVLLLALGVSVFLGITFSRNISRPILAISDGARMIVNGNFDVRIKVDSGDEIGQLAEEFNEMTVQLAETMHRLAREVEKHQTAERQVRELNDELELRVEKRTSELSNANEALAESLSILRSTQRHLVETEKQSALGNLVVGIAHELNTPIGVSMTASSFLGTKTTELRRQIAGNALTRQGLDDFLADIEQACGILDANLGRTAERIRFFKQIAADQESWVIGEVKLREYLEEINLGLERHLRKDGHRFDNRVPSGIEITTWPGALYQVFTNLVMNAVQHAFPGIREGIVTYTAGLADDGVWIEVADNGVGMAAETLPRVFDPFFTTDRGSGRSGLGLSICHNLVTAKLGGRISCRSAPGQGTVFRLELPLETPRGEAAAPKAEQGQAPGLP